MTKAKESRCAAPRARDKAHAPETAKSADEAQSGPRVAPQERHRLAECCAFFKAEYYREAEPGHIREQDIEAAERDIEAVLNGSGKT